MAALLRHRSGVLTRNLGRLLAALVLVAAAIAVASAAFLDAVLVDVNGAITTASDVAIARALSLFGLKPSDASIRIDDVHRVVDARLVAEEAMRLQITPAPEDVDEAWRAAADRLGGMNALRQWLDQAGLDEAWVRTLVEADVRRRRFTEVRFHAFVFVSEDELTETIGPGSHSLDAREKALSALREAGIARELAAWLTEARARATIRYANIGPAGVPLPFSMPAGVAPAGRLPSSRDHS